MIDILKKELINFFRNSKDELIKKAMKENDINPDDLTQIGKYCRVEIYPDCSEIYFFKDSPFLTIKEEKISYTYGKTDFNYVVNYDIIHLQHNSSQYD